jgi:hypothetical protein
MSNQYARVKNAVKGEDDSQDQPAITDVFIDEFLKDAIKRSNLYEKQDAEYELRNPEHNVYTSVRMNSFCKIIV